MTDSPLKVLYWGDSPTACTGFGTVAREILLRLTDTGRYEFITLGINYFGAPHPYEGLLRIFPTTPDDLQGQGRITQMLSYLQPDLLFTLNDCDALDWFGPVYVDVCRQLGWTVPWVWYTPIDGEPLPRAQVPVLRDLVTRTVTTSEYGRGVIQRSIPVLDVPVVYHGVDGATFRPLEDELRGELRQQLGIGDRFVVLSVGVNQIRKQYGTLIEAFAAFRRGKEDRVRLCIHGDPATPYGYDIRRIAAHHGFDDEIVFTNPQAHPGGLSESQLAFVYNLGDVAVFPHCGEGFGLCHLEAMACGVPVVAHGATATPEVVGEDAGILVPTEQVPGPDGEPTDLRLYFPAGDRAKHRPLISLSGLVQAMERLYADAELRGRMGAAGRERATSGTFDWDAAASRFDQILTAAAGRS